jgi:glycosyltransferase involved in cell wall biosynthesis
VDVVNDQRVTITVVVPNRNDAPYLRRCLASVLGQRRPPDELIFVDDESTDESVSVARSLLADCPYARIVENPTRLGTNGAINVGLRLAHSQFVFFLSSNDDMLPELLARAATCLERFPSAGLWSSMTWTIDERRGIRLYPSAVIAQKDTFLSPPACRRLAYRVGSWFMTPIFNREALLEVGGFDPSLQGLSDLFAAMVIAARRGAVFSPAPLGIWRLHENSLLSGTMSDESFTSAVERFQRRGTELASELFTPRMRTRTELRLYFSSLRWSRGGTLPFVMAHVGPAKRATMAVVAAVMGPRSGRGMLALIFAVMRPFDVIPTIRYRLLGSLLVRLHAWRSAPVALPVPATVAR